jgi:hypothetical protein
VAVAVVMLSSIIHNNSSFGDGHACHHTNHCC